MNDMIEDDRDQHIRVERDYEEMKNIRKGYIPVLVGRGDGNMEKNWLPIKLIQHPTIVELLEKSADEFGYHQQGLLRISSDADTFKGILRQVSRKQVARIFF
ncbi:hypothetical protein L6164_031227 [Bauhinia variegata]|uniref:Uncharacterized protein n=1 Tax=Bauhinia variegata TaxID=167791 RepID=A0ACB9LFP1_BAUVA|nr:hypothetical protein L6164_031227 [Bauhinia variegata]